MDCFEGPGPVFSGIITARHIFNDLMPRVCVAQAKHISQNMLTKHHIHHGQTPLLNINGVKIGKFIDIV